MDHSQPSSTATPTRPKVGPAVAGGLDKLISKKSGVAIAGLYFVNQDGVTSEAMMYTALIAGVAMLIQGVIDVLDRFKSPNN